MLKVYYETTVGTFSNLIFCMIIAHSFPSFRSYVNMHSWWIASPWVCKLYKPNVSVVVWVLTLIWSENLFSAQLGYTPQASSSAHGRGGNEGQKYTVFTPSCISITPSDTSRKSRDTVSTNYSYVIIVSDNSKGSSKTVVLPLPCMVYVYGCIPCSCFTCLICQWSSVLSQKFV